MPYNETPTLERHNVFTNLLHTAAFILFPARMFDDEEASQMYIQFQMFMLPRLFVGAIKDSDDLIAAMEDFVATLNFDED